MWDKYKDMMVPDHSKAVFPKFYDINHNFGIYTFNNNLLS